jgi:hypothetical protein
VNLSVLENSQKTVKNSKSNAKILNKKVTAHELNALFQANLKDPKGTSPLTPFESLAHQFLKISFYLGTENYLAFIQTAAVINGYKKEFINQLKLNDKVNIKLADIQQMAENYKGLKQKDEIKNAYRFLNKIIDPESNKIQNSFNPNKISKKIENMQKKKEEYNSTMINLEKRQKKIEKNQKELKNISNDINKLNEYEKQKQNLQKEMENLEKKMTPLMEKKVNINSKEKKISQDKSILDNERKKVENLYTSLNQRKLNQMTEYLSQVKQSDALKTFKDFENQAKNFLAA